MLEQAAKIAKSKDNQSLETLQAENAQLRKTLSEYDSRWLDTIRTNPSLDLESVEEDENL